MLKLCDTCNGTGACSWEEWTNEGRIACRTCEGSGFSNATAAEAWEAEIAARRGDTKAAAA